jgi:pyruvate kinase
VSIMDRIIAEVEHDPAWRAGLEASHTPAAADTPDAICCALRRVAELLQPAATVAFTHSGFSSLRASRERPVAPILALTPRLTTARRLALAWGVVPVPFDEVHDIGEMIAHATAAARRQGVAQPGDTVVVIAGIPFGQSGSTNLLHVVKVPG